MAGKSPVDQLFGGSYQSNESPAANGPAPVDQLFGGRYAADADPEAANRIAADIPRPSQPIGDERGMLDRLRGNYDSLLDEVGAAHQIDPRLLKGVMMTESSGNPNAFNRGSNAAGLFQMTPIAVEEVNRQFGTQYNLDDRFDPAKSADMGAKYLGLQLKKAGGDTELALRFYNGGYNRARWGKENAAYAGKVFANADEDLKHPENQSVDSRYAMDVLDNAMRFNAPDRSDFMRGFKGALSSAWEDSTSGLAGYLQTAMGNAPSATRNYNALQAQQQELAELAKPQDQWSGVRTAGEGLDFAANTAGNALGSTIGPLAGAALGAPFGPLGVIVGAGVPLAAQYIGNTWGGSVRQNTRPGQAPMDTIENMDAGDLARIGGAGLARAGLELGANAAAAGLGGVLTKIVPTSLGGGIFNLLTQGLSNPIDKIGAGVISEGLTEAADVPLEALGTGRKLSDIRGQELTDAAIAGGLGGAGMVAGGQAVTNPRGLAASIRGQIPGKIGSNYRPDYQGYSDNQQAYGPVPSEGDYSARYYNDRDVRQSTRIGSPGINTEGTLDAGRRISIATEKAARERAAAAAAAEEARIAEAQRVPTIAEVHQKMLDEYKAMSEQIKGAKVTEKDYLAARDEHLAQDPEGTNIPTELQSFAAFKQARTKAMVKPKVPTLADAVQRRREMLQDRFANPQDLLGPRDNPAARTGPQDFMGPRDNPAARTGPQQPQKLLPSPEPVFERGPRSLASYPKGPIQADMFGGGGTIIPVDSTGTALVGEAPEQVGTEADPNQTTIFDAIAENDRLAVRRRDAAAFNRAEREAAKQRAKEEDDAARRTTPKNKATFEAQRAAQEQNIPAEQNDVNDRFRIARRQVQRLNKAQAEAERARVAMENAKEQAHAETLNNIRNATSNELLESDRLKWVEKRGQWELFPNRRLGRPPKGFKYAKVLLNDGTLAGHVLRDQAAVPTTTPEITNDIPAESVSVPDVAVPDAAQPAAAKKTRTRRVKAKQEADVAPAPERVEVAPVVAEAAPVEPEVAPEPEPKTLSLADIEAEAQALLDERPHVKKKADREMIDTRLAELQKLADAQSTQAPAAAPKKAPKKVKEAPTLDDLVNKIDEIMARPKKPAVLDEELEKIARAVRNIDYATVDLEPIDNIPDLLFNKDGSDVGNHQIRKFLAMRSLAEQKGNPFTLRSVLAHGLDLHEKGQADLGFWLPLVRALSQMKSLEEVSVSFDPSSEELGSFNPANGRISINDRGGWRTVMHEAVHAATVKGMLVDPALHNAIRQLHRRAREFTMRNRETRAAKLFFQYGFTNEFEFLAEALTNPEFQDTLRSMNFDAEQTFWDRLVQAVKGFFAKFGASPELRTALDAALELSSAAMVRTEQVGSSTLDTEERALFQEVLYNKDFNAAMEKAYPALQTTWGRASDFVKESIIQFNGIPQLAEWFSHLDSLQMIHDAEIKMQNAHNEMAESTKAVQETLRELPDRVQKSLYRLMVDSTLERIHPDVGLDDPLNAHVKDEDAKFVHERLAAQFNAMPKEGQDAYRATRTLFQNMLDRRKKALVDLTEKFSGTSEAAKMKKNLDMLSRNSPGPYFPLMRFGNFIAVWKSKAYSAAEDAHDNAALNAMKGDPTHYLVSFEQTQGDAERQVKAWVEENGLDRTDLAKSRPIARADFSGGVNQSLMPLLRKMESALDTTLGGPEAANEAKQAVREVFLSALPDASIFTSAIRRRNVRGVKSDEMLRAVASHGASQAFHISRLEHSNEVQEGLQKLRGEDSKAVHEGKQKSFLYPTLTKAIAGLYEQDPTTIGSEVAGALTTTLYYSRLALNPAFMVTSFLSPAMVSIPYMGGRHSVVSGYRAWNRAVVDAAKIVTNKHMLRFSFHDQLLKADLPQDERDMLMAVEKAGGIDQTALRELNNVARDDKFDDLKRTLGSVAHRVEVLSRISTALTAYRLEKKRTGNEATARDYAVEVVDKTLINYTHAHTPLILRKGGALSTPVMRVIFQFARYQIGMANLIGHNFREAWVSKSVSESRRQEARKQFTMLATIHALATGAGGAFGANLLIGLTNMVVGLFNPDDEPADIEKKARKILDDLSVEISGSKNLSIALRKGIPAAFGLDLSARLGMADILSPRRENPFKGTKEEMAAGLVGAIPGVSHMLDWIQWARDPKMKTFPVSLVSNFAKAYELGDQGMLSRHGVVKKGAEDYSAVDLVLQGLGFPPTESTEAFANQESARNLDKAIASARQDLLDRWNNAMAVKDKEAVTDARREIQEFNSRHKGQRDVIITPDTLTKSRKQRIDRERRMNSEGVYIPKRGAWRKQNFTDEES